MRKLLIYIGLIIFLNSSWAPAWGEKTAIYMVIFGLVVIFAKGMARTEKSLPKDVKQYYDRASDPTYYDNHYKDDDYYRYHNPNNN